MLEGRQNYSLGGRLISVDAAASDNDVEMAIRAAIASPAIAQVAARMLWRCRMPDQILDARLDSVSGSRRLAAARRYFRCNKSKAHERKLDARYPRMHV
jgi:hypothetical protein